MYTLQHLTTLFTEILVWQARRASNPQPSVLETDALPIELLAYNFPHGLGTNKSQKSGDPDKLNL